MLRKIALALAGCLSLISSGCAGDQKATSEATGVVLVGDQVRVAVLQRIADDHRASSTADGVSLTVEFPIGESRLHFTTLAADSQSADSLLSAADVAIIVIDASEYKPSTFDACAQLLARKSSLEILLLFANTRKLVLDRPDAIELLELSELDVRDHLNAHGLEGDNAGWFYDFPNVVPDDRPPMGTSLGSVVEYIAGRKRDRHRP